MKDWISLQTSTASSWEPDPLSIFRHSLRNETNVISCLATRLDFDESCSCERKASMPELTVSFSLRLSRLCSRSYSVKNGSPGSCSSKRTSQSWEVMNLGVFDFSSGKLGDALFSERFRHANPMLVNDLFTLLHKTLFFVKNTWRCCWQSSPDPTQWAHILKTRQVVFPVPLWIVCSVQLLIQMKSLSTWVWTWTYLRPIKRMDFWGLDCDEWLYAPLAQVWMEDPCYHLDHPGASSLRIC